MKAQLGRGDGDASCREVAGGRATWRIDASRQSLSALRSATSSRGSKAIGPPRPSNRSEIRTPSLAMPAMTASLAQPAKQWTRIARLPSVMLSEGVRSAWAGQQHIPRERDQVPPSASTIVLARTSSDAP